MAHFEELQLNSDIQKLIKDTFDADLPLSGGWGYTKEGATIIEALPEGMSIAQLQHMLTSIRAHLEMNITREPENRYGAVNANEKAREEIKSENALFDKVTYEISGMKEDLYNAFIKEYKEGYGKEDFDMNDHFRRRSEATLIREVVYYFDVTALHQAI